MTTPDTTLADALSALFQQMPLTEALTPLAQAKLENILLKLENNSLRSALTAESEVSDNGHDQEEIPAEVE
jgi:regulator of replication initiation timing